MESYLAVENEDIQIRWHGGSTFNVAAVAAHAAGVR